MRFNLIDKVLEISADRLVAVKQVSLAEEYLADHFPTFPVLPGVMMLEALVQGAAWLIHRKRDFGCSMAVLKEARNVKYGTFVAPGNALRIEVDAVKWLDDGATFKANGTVNGNQAVAARLQIAYFNLSSRGPEMEEIDRRLIAHHRRRWELLLPPGTIASTSPMISGAMSPAI